MFAEKEYHEPFKKGFLFARDIGWLVSGPADRDFCFILYPQMEIGTKTSCGSSRRC
jgi:hypothetical protein